jgi:hypothetical protein
LLCVARAERISVGQIERDMEAKGWPLATEYARAVERTAGACEIGTGERYTAALPTEPSFEVVHDELPAERVPPAAVAADVAAESDRREAALLREFAANLRVASGGVGAGLWQRSRVTDAPRRPAAGWGLLVKPLGNAGGAVVPAQGAYVAAPDGSRRELNADEAALLHSQRVKPRRKLT